MQDVVINIEKGGIHTISGIDARLTLPRGQCQARQQSEAQVKGAFLPACQHCAVGVVEASPGKVSQRLHNHSSNICR